MSSTAGEPADERSGAPPHSYDAGLRITVVVSSRDRAAQLSEALPAVIATLGEGDELLVVDSASTGPDTRAVAEALDVRVVREDRPGLSRARNTGLRAARTPIVAFTDDDCRPEADWLAALRGSFVDQAIGFTTGPSLADRSGRLTSVLERKSPERYRGRQDAEGIGHGANMAFRRDALIALGGFDELLGAGAEFGSGEDGDMLYRMLEAGWEGAYVPEAAVTHQQWRSLGQLLRVRYRYGLGNAAYRVKVLRRDRSTGLSLLGRIGYRCLEYTFWSAARLKPGELVRALAFDAGLIVGVARARFEPLDGAVFRAGRRIPAER